MIIQSIELQDFRNYTHQKVEFDEKTNIFYGDNAQGKTNLLEAVYVCGTTKSHKGSRDKDMIRFEAEEAHLCMLVKKKQSSYKIDMHLKRGKPKGVAVNGVPIRRSGELFGIANLVFFSPEDLQMIKRGPAERRRFVNLELGQLDKVYLYDLNNYNRALNQRNELLKVISFRSDLSDTLPAWDTQLVKFGVGLIRRRGQFAKQLNALAEKVHREITGGREQLQIVYEPDVSEDAFSKELEKASETDRRRGTTTVGPHHDDLKFMINGVDIRKFGSQGQQRTAALSVKLAEIALVKQVTGDVPVLILDDVLSELDGSRQNDLLSHINDTQTLISCTGLDEFVSRRFPVDKVFCVRHGEVEAADIKIGSM